MFPSVVTMSDGAMAPTPAQCFKTIVLNIFTLEKRSKPHIQNMILSNEFCSTVLQSQKLVGETILVGDHWYPD